MKMHRTEDSEAGTLTFSIPNFPFVAQVTVDQMIPTNRDIRIQDNGGVVEVSGTKAEYAESMAKQMLFHFYKSGVAFAEAS
jgi:hypothetical protein